MAAVGVLIEQHRIAQFLQPRRRLAGVAGVDAIVLGRGVDEDLGIGLARAQVLIGRILLDPGPLFRNVRIAVFRDPAGPGQQAVEAQHVEQGHLDDRRIDQVRALGQHRPHEQPALRPAHDAESRLAGDAARDQVHGHGLIVLMRPLAVLLQGRLMPVGAELAATAGIGDDIDPAPLQPQLADRGRIAGQQRRLEAAVAVQQGRVRAVHRHGVTMDDEIGDHGAVGRAGLELVDPHSLGIEFGRQGFGQVRLARRRIGQEQAGRVQIAGDADEDLVIPLAGRTDADRDILRQVHAAARPLTRRIGLIDIDRAAHVLVQGHDQFVAGAGDAFDGLARPGADDQLGPDGRIGQPGREVIGDDVAGPEFLP